MESVNQFQRKNLVSANEAAEILSCSRQYIEILQLKGKLIPVSTVFPKYFFNREQVQELADQIRK